jgi:hypothetical protein
MIYQGKAAGDKEEKGRGGGSTGDSHAATCSTVMVYHLSMTWLTHVFNGHPLSSFFCRFLKHGSGTAACTSNTWSYPVDWTVALRYLD